MSTPTGCPIALCEALAGGLNAAQQAQPATFATAFTARREYTAFEELDSMREDAAPLVLIVPQSDAEKRLGGGATPVFSGAYEVSLAIVKRVGIGEPARARLDALMLLRQQILDWLKGVALVVEGPRSTRAVLAEIESEPSYFHGVLAEKHVFLSETILRFTLAV